MELCYSNNPSIRNYILPGCYKTGTVKKEGSGCHVCEAEVCSSMVCSGNGLSNCAMREFRKPVCLMVQAEGVGEHNNVFIKSLPRRLSLQGIKPGGTEYREAAQRDVCAAFLL